MLLPQVGFKLRRKKFRILKKEISFFIIIVLTLMFIALSSVFCSIKFISNDKILFGNKKYNIKNKLFEVKNFERLKENGKGPITIDREKDDGTKIDMYSKIIDSEDNKFENYFLIGNSERKFSREQYMCEYGGTITEDMIQGNEISCPILYHIEIKKVFYGRYVRDTDHCMKGNSENSLSKINRMLLSCGVRDSKGFVKNLCEGKNSCIIQANNKYFKDKCPGIKKYLHVKYDCVRNKEIVRPKMAVVMFANNIRPNSVYENSLSEFYQYCDIHGYTFIFNDQRYDEGRDLFYMKLHVIVEAIMRGLKTKEYDWIFWVDGDVALTNPNIQLEAFLPQNEKINFIAASDRNGLNAGVFLIKVNSWSLNFMMRAITHQYTNRDARLKYADQTSLSNVLMFENEEEHYVIVPQQWFNVYAGNRKKGDFLVHFAGRSGKDGLSLEMRTEVYKDMEWVNSQTNKQLRENVLKYYALPREKQRHLKR